MVNGGNREAAKLGKGKKSAKKSAVKKAKS
jgi:hypothetical protein